MGCSLEGGIVGACKIDGVKAVYISPDWNTEKFIDGFGAATAVGFTGVLIDKLFPKTDMSALGIAGALIGGVIYVYVESEGYYTLDSKNMPTKTCIYKGKIYDYELE